MENLLTIKDLKKLVMVSKRTDKDKSSAYAAILKQVESKTIGVKNPETNEQKLILNAAKSELKEQKQSKSSGAPYSDLVITICEGIVDELSGDMMSDEDIEKAVKSIVESGENNKGKIMGTLKKTYQDSIDMSKAQSIVTKVLSA